MKRAFYFIFATAIVIFITSCHRPPNDPDDNKGQYIAYWSFDDGTAKDLSGNGFNGTFVNSPQIVDGHSGKCIRLVGKNWYCPTNGDISTIGSHVLLPPIDFTQYPEFTISLWVNEEGYSYIGGEPYIWWGHFENGWMGILNHPISSETNLTTAFTLGSRDWNSCYLKPFNYDLRNTWVHYAITYSGGLMRSYINSILVDSRPQKISYVMKNGALGRHWWYYDEERTSARFTGMIDEVKIFKKALSDSAVQALYLQ